MGRVGYAEAVQVVGVPAPCYAAEHERQLSHEMVGARPRRAGAGES
jgi:hypothetical protein